MATETLKEYRKMAQDELVQKEGELRGELFKLRTGGATEKVKDTSRTGKLKKDIARIKTILRERELQNSTKAQA
jgi:large subunit ribosomal protein L29